MNDTAIVVVGGLLVAGVAGIVALLWRMSNAMAAMSEWMKHVERRLGSLEKERGT